MGNVDCCCSEVKGGITVEKEGQHAQTPKIEQPPSFYWASDGGETTKKRMDPADGQSHSFEELAYKYTGTYTPEEIKSYWEYECWPVGSETGEGVEHEAETSEVCEFTIRLRKTGDEMFGMGLRKAATTNQVVIKKPTGKALEEWHAHNPGKEVRDCDEIVAVNGNYDKADVLINQLTSPNTTDTEITLRRQCHITVDINMAGPIGLKLDPHTLVTCGITYGALSRRNQACPPNVEIVVGDQLVEVNGMHWSYYNLNEELAKLKDGDQVQLIFTRPRVVD